MKTRGFTMVELLVALAVLEVGLLGAVGLLVLAARTMTAAETLERGAAVGASVLDSLIADGVQGQGRTPWMFGEVRWTVTADGRVAVLVLEGADTLLTVDGRALETETDP